MHSKSILLNEPLAKSGVSVLLKVEPSRSSHSQPPHFSSYEGTVFPKPDRLGGYLRHANYQVPSKSIIKRKSSSFRQKVLFDSVDVREYDRTVGDNVRIHADHLCVHLILMKCYE
jgi:hypothetical protein